VLAGLLGLQVTLLSRNLLDNSLSLLSAFLWARLQITSYWTAKLKWLLETFSMRGDFLDCYFLDRFAFNNWPLVTLLLSGVTLGDILTLLFIDSLATGNIILNIMYMVSGFALGTVLGPAHLLSGSTTDKWSGTDFDWGLRRNLLVFNEATLDKVLLALLLLLGLKVSGVGGVTLLTVAVLAGDNVVILSLLNHFNLVNATLSSSSNTANA